MTKHIAIIGASGGIGSALTKRFADASEVTKVHAFSRRAITFDHDKISEQPVDFTDEHSLKAAAESAKWDTVICAIGLLHNNGDIKPEKTYKEINPTQFHKVLEANTVIPALIAKHFLPNMNKSTPNVFAILSARVGSISDNRLGGWYSYRAAKAATNMLIKTLSIETKRINKNCIVIGLHPGTVDTSLSQPFKGNVPAHKLFSPEQSAHYLFDVIQARAPEDTGNVFAWDGQAIEP